MVYFIVGRTGLFSQFPKLTPGISRIGARAEEIAKQWDLQPGPTSDGFGFWSWRVFSDVFLRSLISRCRCGFISRPVVIRKILPCRRAVNCRLWKNLPSVFRFLF